MKEFILFTRRAVWWILLLPLAVAAQSQDTFPSYVVIGAFAHERNALHFTDEARNNNFPAQFEMNPSRNLYYVYVVTTADREYAITEALRLRTETKYIDTWVYSGGFGAQALKRAPHGQPQDLDPSTGEVIESVLPEQKQRSSGKHDAPTNQSVKLAGGLDAQSTVKNVDASTQAQPLTKPQQLEESFALRGDAILKGSKEGVAPKRMSTQSLTSEEVAGKNFYFHLFRADNLRVLEGEVDAVDFERSRKMATYAANSAVRVMMPAGKSKQISFVCQVFGFRKYQREFDPGAPAEDLYLDEEENLVMPFELVRLQKGDIAIMYNVFFFRDAAVMRPESRYEVNHLLDLLNENPSYKIRIHGHTNGNASGRIIKMGVPGNFYSLAGTKEGFGSAKKLSEERAAVMREFLINSGVSSDRMQIKAWGGKKPIHDKHSTRANENVRVEIEILSD